MPLASAAEQEGAGPFISYPLTRTHSLFSILLARSLDLFVSCAIALHLYLPIYLYLIIYLCLSNL